MAENNLMLALWREAGRHVDATDSIPLLAGLLGVSLPVSGLRLDERSQELSDLVTLAEWSARTGLGQRAQSRGCSAAGMEAFERWAGRRELIARAPGEHWPTVLRDIDPGTDRDWALAGPLLTGDGVVGLAVLRSPRAVDAAEKALFQAALGVDQIGAGDQIGLFGLLGAGFKSGGSLWLQRQGGVVDLLAPVTGAGEEHGDPVAQAVGRDELALFDDGHDAALRM